ncbi:hypothetical protein JX265_001147 [Neoarthrinium moseri]|uniref:Nephrocystin 3-like N-terminal domain-containing protein n=1 Tax=Neoarthrinium moseri TaxID=1658444 RepID=A0A9P9WX46_9PEZI|nr:hypothetical protein JX265_001147 [Neoarthrinium moseri]
MAEAVAFGASVVAFLQLTDRVVDIAKYYIEAIKDCPADIRAILVEVSLLKAVLQSLSFILESREKDGGGPSFLGNLAGEHGPVEMCRKALAALEKLLPADFHAVQGKRQKIRSAATHLAWPLRESSAKKLLETISRYRASISFALTYDATQDIKDIRRDMRYVKETLTADQRNKICHWLESTNPSSSHNSAWELREDFTGLWMTDSEEWAKWLAGKEKFLWIHGIPGAGKTVLASYLVEEARSYCRNSARRKQTVSIDLSTTKPTVSVYYYCYFARNHDEAAPFLRWLLGQLCRHSNLIPTEIVALYETAQVPSLSVLLEAVSVSLRYFETVFVLVDAVDESSQRHNLLKILRDLVTDHRFDTIRLLATSREYYDIETCFEGISTAISMNNPVVETDIGRFVHSALLGNKRFRSWPASLTHQVERALTKGAKGMFRWAVCQIDVIQRLRSREEIYKAVSDLPKSLDETYERIFHLLPEEDSGFVRYALIFICANNNSRPVPISATVLLHGLAFRLTPSLKPGGEEYDVVYNNDVLRDRCGCLISFSGDEDSRQVSLAHYTVKEFLYSDRISRSQVSGFALSDKLVTAHIVTTIIHVIAENWNPNSSGERHTLYHYCLLMSMVGPSGGSWKWDDELEHQHPNRAVAKFRAIRESSEYLLLANHVLVRERSVVA